VKKIEDLEIKTSIQRRKAVIITDLLSLPQPKNEINMQETVLNPRQVDKTPRIRILEDSLFSDSV